MIGTELGTVKDMLSKAFTRAADARSKAEGKAAADVKASEAAPRKDTADPAFLLSASLEDLTGRLRDMSKGASDRAKDGVSRADDALSQMQGIADFTEEFAKQLDGVMQAMERDLGRLLEAFGMDEESRKEALKGFRSRFGDEEKANVIAAAQESRQSESLSVEAKNIELTIEHEGKSLTITYDSATLDLSRSESQTSVITNGRSTALSHSSSDTSVNAERQGLTVDAKGFTDEELSGLMEHLGSALKDGTLDDSLEGLARLTASSKREDGEGVKLSLDLSAAIKTAFGVGKPDDTAAPAATPATAGVSILA